ncbi:hypothetical protein HWV62_1951 [Athelia sp. TMB]|nr:hypothetical protein HWV62_1951 [Athelia sp. TMB]
MAALLRSAAAPIRWLSKRLRNISLEGVVYVQTTVPSREEGRSITVDIYRPAGQDTTRPAAVLVNMHGSGFVIPGLGADRKFCCFVATHSSCTVFDIDYRKAPEHPFPAATEDVEDVVSHLTTLPDQYDVSNIFLSGFSAGGTLALSVGTTLGPDIIKDVVAAYPAVDCSKQYVAPEKEFSAGFVIPRWMGDLYYDAYILPDQSRKDPRVSPLFAAAERFPRHLYLACGRADSLFEPTAMLAQKLKDAGHQDLTFSPIEGEAHSYDKRAMEGSISAGRRDRMYAEAVLMIERAMSS